jgi:hypothetical protein
MKQSTPIRNAILEELSFGPVKTGDLIAKVAKDSKTTIQGVYKALRQLRDAEVIIKRNKTITLSSVWLTSEIERLERIEKTYSLKEKLFKHSEQDISFKFQTLNELDLFWTHAFLSLEETCSPTDISIAIAPHDWFNYSRKSTDTAWVKKHTNKKRTSWLVITHAQILDKKVISLREKEAKYPFSHLFKNPLNQEEHVYYNCIGPYTFKTTLDKKVAKLLNTFIESHTILPLLPDTQKQIGTIMKTKGLFHISITKSEYKTEQIRKKLYKYFI